MVMKPLTCLHAMHTVVHSGLSITSLHLNKSVQSYTYLCANKVGRKKLFRNMWYSWNPTVGCWHKVPHSCRASSLSYCSAAIMCDNKQAERAEMEVATEVYFKQPVLSMFSYRNTELWKEITEGMGQTGASNSTPMIVGGSQTAVAAITPPCTFLKRLT